VCVCDVHSTLLQYMYVSCSTLLQYMCVYAVVLYYNTCVYAVVLYYNLHVCVCCNTLLQYMYVSCGALQYILPVGFWFYIMNDNNREFMECLQRLRVLYKS